MLLPSSLGVCCLTNASALCLHRLTNICRQSTRCGCNITSPQPLFSPLDTSEATRVQCGYCVSTWKSLPCSSTVLENSTMLVKSNSASRALSVPLPGSDRSIISASHDQRRSLLFAWSRRSARQGARRDSKPDQSVLTGQAFYRLPILYFLDALPRR
jgi:hypothetical protein